MDAQDPRARVIGEHHRAVQHARLRQIIDE
jgi:hypothetical protein